MAFAPSIHLIDDRDLDDAELWAVIDSAAASRSSSRPRKPLLALQNGSPYVSPAPFSARAVKLTPKNPNFKTIRVEEEVLEEEQWDQHRPAKMARIIDRRSYRGDQTVYVRHPLESPTLERGEVPVNGVGPLIEPTRLDFCHVQDTEDQNHGLSGRFPSVALFKQYQNAALSVRIIED